MATFYSNISSYYQLRLDISQASQDITNNTSSVYYKLTLTSGYSSFAKWGHIRWLIINGATVYSETSQIAIGAQSSLVLAEGYTTVSHNSDGTKTVSFSASFDSGGSRPAYIVQTALVLSGTLALTTIPRASMISRTYASRELGETQTFSISRAIGSFTHTVRYRIGSGGWTNIATGVATSQTWTLPASLASSVTNNTKATITVECLTYNGGTHIGTSSTSFEMTIPNNATYQPNVSINSGYPSIVNPLGGVAVQGKSSIRVISSYSGNYGASIASVKATINGVNYSGKDVTSAVINATGNVPITVTVTDTRGYSKTTTTAYVNFVAYSNPVITAFTAVRHPTNQDTGVLIFVNFSISPVSNQNAKYYHIKYRPVGGSWTTVQSSSSIYSLNTTIPLGTGTADANLSYEFELEVRDSYNTSSKPVKRTVTFGTAFELINFNSSGKGVAFGKYSELPNWFELGMNFAMPNVDGGYTIIKDDGNVAIALGSPSHDNTSGAGMQLWHDGLIKARAMETTDNVTVGGKLATEGNTINSIPGGFLSVSGNSSTTLKLPRRGAILLITDQGGAASASKGAWIIWLGGNANGTDYTRIVTLENASNVQVSSANLSDGYTTLYIANVSSGSFRYGYIRLVD